MWVAQEVVVSDLYFAVLLVAYVGFEILGLPLGVTFVAVVELGLFVVAAGWADPCGCYGCHLEMSAPGLDDVNYGSGVWMAGLFLLDFLGRLVALVGCS